MSARYTTGSRIGCARTFFCACRPITSNGICAGIWRQCGSRIADKEEAEASRASVVAPAPRSNAAVKKQTTGLTPDGLPVHSFRSLLADLATMARNTIITAITPNHPLIVVTRPTVVQQKAFDLLGLTV
jgi:hypothetical protein